MQALTPVLDFLKEYGKDLKVWMKFWFLNLIILFASLYLFEVDVNKAISKAFTKELVEMYIQPEKVSDVSSILSQTTNGSGADGAYVFAYLPMYAIKSSTLLQIHESKGINYLSFEQFTNVPVTIDGDWFLKMKAQELYHRKTSPTGVYSSMYERGVRHIYSYPITGRNNVLYGNLTVVYDGEPDMADEHIKEYLKVGAENIVRMLEL